MIVTAELNFTGMFWINVTGTKSFIKHADKMFVIGQTTNPYWIQEYHAQWTQKINVWTSTVNYT